MAPRLVALVVADDLTALDSARSAHRQAQPVEIVLWGDASEAVEHALDAEGIAARVVSGTLPDSLRGPGVTVLDHAALLPGWSDAAQRFAANAEASAMQYGSISLRADGAVETMTFPGQGGIADPPVLGVVVAGAGSPPVPPRAAASQRRAEPERVTVVIPAHNAASSLRETLQAITAQESPVSFEVVVVDDGSTDGTARCAADVDGGDVSVRVVRRSVAGGPSAARNAGAADAHGDLLVFCDADDVPEPGWIAAIAAAARDADVVSPTFAVESLGEQPYESLRAVAADPTAATGSRARLARVTGNCAVWADVARAVGGWNERFSIAEDYEFAWRAQLAGYGVGVAPEARVRYRTRPDVRSELRQVRSYAAARAQLYKEFRDAGVLEWDFEYALRRWGWLARHSPSVVRPGASRREWLRAAASAAGRIEGSMKQRVLFL